MKFLSLLSFITLVCALPYSSYVVHESRSPGALPSSWRISHKAAASQTIPVRIALKHSNRHRLHAELMAVSDPESENYHKYWKPEEVREFFKPAPETHDAVNTWLTGAGFGQESIKIAPGGNWFEVKMTVAEAEALLNSEYHVYDHESGSKHIACSSYSVPTHIQPHIDFITPTVHFDAVLTNPPADQEQGALQKRGLQNLGAPGSLGQGPKVAPSGLVPTDPGWLNWLENLLNPHDELKDCDKMITPPCLRALYNAYYPVTLAGDKNSYGIVEYTPQAYVQSDLDAFFRNFSKPSVGISPTLVSIDGGIVQTTNRTFDFNGESNLDLEYAMALVGAKQPVTLYQVGDIVQGASFNNFLDALDGSYCNYKGGDDPTQDGVYPNPQTGGYKGKDCGIVKPANVISASYGYNEADLTYFYASRQCDEYAKLGMMGVTVLYSSGDFGVAGNGKLCLNSDGSQSKTGTIFNPSFPGGCPYVTSIGATQINNGSSVHDPESACERVIFSGGGFSNYFDIPDWQKPVVDTYFQDHNPPYTSAQYNNSRTSRAFPDFSANGANYLVSIEGKSGLVYGTSASAPVVGAMLTMINDARIAIGKGPIGYINPTIYSDDWRGQVFHDITSGKNPGCGTNGFSAVQGWDPLTGLGTPNFPLMLAKWLAAK